MRTRKVAAKEQAQEQRSVKVSTEEPNAGDNVAVMSTTILTKDVKANEPNKPNEAESEQLPLADPTRRACRGATKSIGII